MKENKYDTPTFFEKYSRMDRSQKGLEGAGEWQALRALLPDFAGRDVLDLGCGFGWHCIWAAEHGARRVVGVDLSENMLRAARERTTQPNVEYLLSSIEDYAYPQSSFDVVLSSLAFHYLPDFGAVCDKVRRTLRQGGRFVFSCEHPVFTAQGAQDWYRGVNGEPLHWPVDRYFTEGRREAVFLGEPVVKYHRTLTTYLNTLLREGFVITDIVEPQPDEQKLDTVPGMRDELRRPMMLIVSAVKG